MTIKSSCERARKFIFALMLMLPFTSFAANHLNGIAVHTELNDEQFIAAIFSETLTDDAKQLALSNEEKAMELRILTERIFPRRFKRMWIESIAINSAPRELEQHAQNLADFANIFSIRLQRGDIVRIERATDGVRVTINNFAAGTIEDTRFFDLLLRTWIGPVPFSSDFKQNLLAGGNVPAAMQSRFNDTRPSEGRIAAVTSALQPPPPAEEEPATDLTELAEADQAAQDALEVAADEAEDEAQQASAEEPAEDEPAAGPGLVSASDLFDDESLLEDDEPDYTFTAKNVLSEQLYISKLTRWTSSFVSYPRAAARRNLEGTVRVTVTLARDGEVKNVRMTEQSRHSILNEAAMSAVRGASPYPAVPDEIPGDSYLFSVPVVFKLR